MNRSPSFAGAGHWAGALVLACAPFLPAQLQVPEGFATQVVHRESSGPYSLSHCAVDASGRNVYVAVRQRIDEIDGQGLIRTIHVLPAGQATGLLVRPRGCDALYFTEYPAGRLHRHDLRLGTTRTLPGIRNAFDLDLGPGGEVLVAAAPDWPVQAGTGGVWLLDPAGLHRQIARIAGPSGPLLLTPGGDLLFAAQSAAYPTPPGSVRILRFGAARVGQALGGGPLLEEREAEVVVAGLDGAYDLELDDRGRLWMSDPQTGAVRRTRPGTWQLEAQPFLAPGGSGVLQIAFADGDAATLDPFQPESGGVLHLLTTDWQTHGAVHRVRALRPGLISSPATHAGPGPVRVVVQDAAALGPVWLLASMRAPVPERPCLWLDGLPLWLGLDPSLALIVIPGSAAASGVADFRFLHPGGFTAELGFQALVATPGLAPALGTSRPHRLILQP